MTTAAVVGVGAIGTFFATHLALGGRAEVTACVRTPVSDPDFAAG